MGNLQNSGSCAKNIQCNYIYISQSQIILITHKITSTVLRWPHLIKDIKKLETLQRWATKFILNDYSRTDWFNSICFLSCTFSKSSIFFFLLKVNWNGNFFLINMFVLSCNAQNNTFYNSIIVNYRVIMPQTQQNVISGKINRNLVTSTRAIA